MGHLGRILDWLWFRFARSAWSFRITCRILLAAITNPGHNPRHYGATVAGLGCIDDTCDCREGR